MPVVDVVFVPALQARQHFLLAGSVPHFDGVGEHAHVHPFADQPRGHRVDVPLDGDRAARLHPHVPAAKRLQPPRRQRIQTFTFVMQCLLLLCITASTHFTQEIRIDFLAREIMAAAHE
jgi:hypothetical protein